MRMVTRFKSFITESPWVHLSPDEVAHHRGELLDIVRHAYRPTELGSFIKNSNQLANSEWLVKRSTEFEDDIEAAIFYRGPRADERWVGRKIQGIGHDGETASKVEVVSQLMAELQKRGTWIEASGALASNLRTTLLPVTSTALLNALFPNSDIYLLDDGSYTRKIDGIRRRETVFGKPVVNDGFAG